MNLKPLFVFGALALGVFAFAQERATGNLVYNSQYSDPAARKWDEKLVALFKARNPGVNLTHNIVDLEAFKQAIRTYLASDNPPDVLTWSAGNRMRFFASKGLAADIGDVWQKEGWTKAYPKGMQALSKTDGKFVFVPSQYYWWAMYYRKDIFEKLGLKEAKTWDEFLGLCDKLNAAGITPIQTGSKFLWPLAGWFDFLDMRVNGPEFHVKLTDGVIPYTDARVKKVFTYWKQLLDRKCFNANHASYDWDEAVQPMIQGKAGMFLMGDFIRDQWKPELVASQLDFFRFPIIDPKLPVGEEAPADGYFISAKAKNLENAKKFIAFLGSKEAMEYAVKDLGRLVARSDVDPKLYAGKPHVQKGIRTIINEADYIAQFYDRDTDPEMANIGMKGFQRFMLEPSKIDDILAELETARQRIFK